MTAVPFKKGFTGDLLSERIIVDMINGNKRLVTPEDALDAVGRVSYGRSQSQPTYEFRQSVNAMSHL